ncbi:MAG: D-aminoacylase [Candidatus Lokiarchaeota archaeon]|nr:D-aminoacylase [Candidatus Lokiarchaeota archaeon]
MSYDIVIKNGRIIDGTGNPAYTSDIEIKHGKIEKIGYNLKDDAATSIDAKGCIICPGFIDIHSHTDYVLPLLSKVESTIQQGITTQTIGMCGDGLAPLHPEKIEPIRDILTAQSSLYKEYEFKWNSFSEYLANMEDIRCPANSAFFVGYGNIRIAGGQGFENRPATQEEMETMKRYLREAMQAGAFGMSTGLIYPPQVYSSTNELIELCKIVAEYGGLYFSHLRGEDENLLTAIKEFIEIVEKSNCIGGQIAHFKVSGKKNWGNSIKALKLVEEANLKGLNITFDQYPYKRGMSNLPTALPPWVLEGGREKSLERIKDTAIQKKIIADIEKGIKGWENWIKNNGFDKLYISTAQTEKWKEIRGKSISQITKIKGLDNDWQTFFQLLIDENFDVMITIESMSDEDIERIMTSPFQMIGTDGAGVPANPMIGVVHPRLFGTYPRIFALYVRERQLLGWEEAIRKMTSFPARKIGLRDRGLIYEGNWADVVVFDPKRIRDKATYNNPIQFPEGIMYVIVNGVIVVDHGKQKRKYPGKILRRAS